MAAGSLLRDACYRALGRLFTFQLLVRKEHYLVTDGPYAYIRSPSYTGMFLLTIGTTASLSGKGSLYRKSGLAGTSWGKALWILWMSQRLFEVSNFLGRTYYEDQFMKEQFGEEWEAWVKGTPYKIIAYVW
ncbi:hypothetical protein OF83DRAFT_1048413 [Amylostereum chailletii]|nr:hypothetical protein OF83DRAFT_1048413 [Amylostereum chailletii]